MYGFNSAYLNIYVLSVSNDSDSLLYGSACKAVWLYLDKFKSMLFAVTIPTGNMSDGLDEDSLVMSNETMSEDMSFIHLADTSMIAITFPLPGFVA